MIRAALAFILLAVLGTAVLAVSPSQNLIMELPHSRAPAPGRPPAACPYSGAGFADGCTGTIPAQNPTLLQQYGANRPPWDVAGVDYGVGQSGPMNDPAVAASLPACASYGTTAAGQNNVTVNTAPCTLSDLDFSLHGGVCLMVDSGITNGGTVTVTNSNFLSGPGCQPQGEGLLNIYGNVNFVATWNTINGQLQPIFQALFQRNNFAGNITAEYNYFIGANQSTIGIENAGTFTIKYNYLNGLGLYPTHADWLTIYGGPPGVVLNEAFNTVFSSPAGCCATSFCYISPSIAGPYSGYCENDTYISSITTQSGVAGNGTVSLPVRVEPLTTMGPITISNIYMDVRGAVDPFGATTATGFTPPVVTCTGNKNLVDGTALTTVLGTGAGWMICH